MSNVMYNYPAMLAHAGEMQGYVGALRGVGSEISSTQGVLAAQWQGDTGTTYQQWQMQWNSAMDELVQAYQQMTTTHQDNTNAMHGTDQVQGGKWV